MSNWSLNIPVREVRKADDGTCTVTGWASVITDAGGRSIIDHDGDVILADELEKAAQTAFLEAGGRGVIGDMHEVTGKGDLVESFVLTQEKRKALGLGDGPEGWLVTLKIRDPELTKQIKSGEKLELSIRGTAKAVPMREAA